MSAAEPLGLLYHLGEPEMRRVAILIDGGLSIYIPSMPDLHDENGKPVVFDYVDYAVVSHSDTPSGPITKFSTARRSRIDDEFFDSRINAVGIGFFEVPEIPDRGLR